MLLLVVSPNLDSATFIDPAAQAVTAKLPAFVALHLAAAALDGGLAFGANQGSDSLSFVGLEAEVVEAEIAMGAAPVAGTI